MAKLHLVGLRQESKQAQFETARAGTLAGVTEGRARQALQNYRNRPTNPEAQEEFVDATISHLRNVKNYKKAVGQFGEKIETEVYAREVGTGLGLVPAAK
jgi:hypothetical protein